MATLFVGNLPFKATESDLGDFFSKIGHVDRVSLIKDRETGRPRGFSFIEMKESDAIEAVKKLDGAEFGGRALKVNLKQAKV
ncbi:hypothetical protein HDU77_000147 [Chytriomyces hyalinus]|uniref:RRM domain-containing protein n=1 Tax=Chytriomyces confervae TaxID=246404 RepID=A0A507FAN4_9FUNG|nr:hypothetical protein HDU77_000147 [Chytriomyces hyalinus]KAJ3399289.1 hypothetical protein HDU80_008099 [Chytriomyces hyalinus]TPX73333.1 hypothetical protein CcCBS67573_g05396 [Chytriomyces confervae]